MRKNVLAVLVALAVLAVVACRDSITGPNPGSRASAKTASKASVATTTTNMEVGDFFGTWQATKVEGSSDLKPGVKRDLVAEGGTVTLMLERTDQILGNAIPSGKYTITVAMPGTKPGVDTGFWFYGDHSIKTGYSEHPQIDFYPKSLGPDAEYGWIPAFLVTLSDNKNTMKLWDSGLTFLPYDFGWGTTPGMTGTVLNLEFIRK